MRIEIVTAADLQQQTPMGPLEDQIASAVDVRQPDTRELDPGTLCHPLQHPLGLQFRLAIVDLGPGGGVLTNLFGLAVIDQEAAGVNEGPHSGLDGRFHQRYRAVDDRRSQASVGLEHRARA